MKMLFQVAWEEVSVRWRTRVDEGLRFWNHTRFGFFYEFVAEIAVVMIHLCDRIGLCFFR